MADYNISAEITADASGFESGIKKAQKASKNLSKSVSGVIQGLGKSGLVGALGAVGLATGGVVTVLNTVTKVAKKVAQTIDECSEAYRKQYQAEIALSTAVNNNPYVDGTATKRLKEFASEMQRVSDIGDEELIPMMADLIAKGRTEEETMQIMSVALDMSAGGTMSLDTAISQLNATLNGNVGRLGQQNAELKDLTAEELKNGKAVEILGEKYKGLAQATADSQKQLRNAIGDLKENIGQIFEQALAPMRKFFTEVITNLNDSITKSRQLKTAMKEVFGDNGEVNLEASTDALNTAFTEVLHKQQEVTRNYQQYIRLYGEYIDQTTDETALSYKAQISDLNAQIKAISEELNKRRTESEKEKARLTKEKADAEAKAELERLAELEGKKLKLQEEWADKLFAIRIENLERQRDLELENEELTEEQKERISEFYGEQILVMRLKQIEKEREQALAQENLTEEASLAINLYYENVITQTKQDEAKKRYKAKKEELKAEEKAEKQSMTVIVKVVQETTKKIAETFKKVVSTIKNVFSGVVNIFGKLFEFNIDDALNAILKWEDNILTFFVETLPALPNFVKSVVQSIKTLLKSIKNVLKGLDLKAIILDILRTLSNNLPEIVSDMLDILVLIINDAVMGLVQWLGQEQGLKMLLDIVLKIQQGIEKVVTDNLDTIVNFLADNVDTIAEFLANSMASANRTLPKIIKAVLKLVTTLIEIIAKAFENDEFVKSIIDSIMQVTDAIIQALPKLITAIVKLIANIISALIPYLPELILQLVTEIADALPSMIGDIVKALSGGVQQIFSKMFTFDFWIDVLSSMTGALGQIIGGAFSGIGSTFTGGSSGGGSGSDVLDFLNPVTSPLSPWNWFAKGTSNASAGLALVGEAGPELVKFRGGEQVLNNRNTNKALANMGGNTNNFNVTFNNLQDTTAFNMMQQLKAYNRQMAINGIM